MTKSFLNQPKVIINHIASYLDDNSLCQLSQASHDARNQLNSILSSKGKIKKLLSYVANGSPLEIKSLLPEILPHDDIVLVKIAFEEPCGRKWSKVSALELAALSADTEIINILLKYVPENLQHVALAQLQGVRDRKKTDENGVYLAPYHELINAYKKLKDRMKTFSKWYDDLDSRIDCVTEYEEKHYILELIKRAKNIGQCQKMLPIVGLQEFCHDRAFDPLPLFNHPPQRSCKIYDIREYLSQKEDKSNLGTLLRLKIFDEGYHLYKEPNKSYPGYRQQWKTSPRPTIAHFTNENMFELGQQVYSSRFDLPAIIQLCRVRENDLANIIQLLLIKTSKNNFFLSDIEKKKYLSNASNKPEEMKGKLGRDQIFPFNYRISDSTTLAKPDLILGWIDCLWHMNKQFLVENYLLSTEERASKILTRSKSILNRFLLGIRVAMGYKNYEGVLYNLKIAKILILKNHDLLRHLAVKDECEMASFIEDTFKIIAVKERSHDDNNTSMESDSSLSINPLMNKR